MKRFLTRAALGVTLVATLGATTGCGSTPPSGAVGVVRNGGPWDNHNIRGNDPKDPSSGIIPNGSGYTWAGFGSEVHYYPVASQQRYYKAEACFNAPDGSDEKKKCTADRGPYKIQTKDGVDLGIEGTAYLNTTFDGSPKGNLAVKDFDTQFATRTFADGLHAYDDVEGWSAFLAAIVDPIASNNLRDVGSGLECAQFVSSCALVQNNSAQQVKADLGAKNNQSNVAFVQDAVAKGLSTDLVNSIGGSKKVAYFANIKFVITKVDLPGKVQTAIDDAQASFAQVSKVNAQVAQAKAQVLVAEQQRQINVKKQKGYNACHSCQVQDEFKALPSGLQTYAPGAAFAVR